MFICKNRYSVLSKAIAVALVCLFLVNDIAWSNPIDHSSSNATLAAQSRLKPFFEKYGLDFQNIFAVSCAAGELRKIIMAGDIRPGHIVKLNKYLKDKLHNYEVEIDRAIETGKLSSEKEYACVVFDFKKEKKQIKVLLLKDYANLTARDWEELKKFGIKNDIGINHLNYPGIEGTWLINLVASQAQSVPESKEIQLARQALSEGRLLDSMEQCDKVLAAAKKDSDEYWQAYKIIDQVLYTKIVERVGPDIVKQGDHLPMFQEEIEKLRQSWNSHFITCIPPPQNIEIWVRGMSKCPFRCPFCSVFSNPYGTEILPLKTIKSVFNSTPRSTKYIKGILTGALPLAYPQLEHILENSDIPLTKFFASGIFFINKNESRGNRIITGIKKHINTLQDKGIIARGKEATIVFSWDSIRKKSGIDTVVGIASGINSVFMKYPKAKLKIDAMSTAYMAEDFDAQDVLKKELEGLGYKTKLLIKGEDSTNAEKRYRECNKNERPEIMKISKGKRSVIIRIKHFYLMPIGRALFMDPETFLANKESALEKRLATSKAAIPITPDMFSDFLFSYDLLPDSTIVPDMFFSNYERALTLGDANSQSFSDIVESSFKDPLYIALSHMAYGYDLRAVYSILEKYEPEVFSSLKPMNFWSFVHYYYAILNPERKLFLSLMLAKYYIDKGVIKCEGKRREEFIKAVGIDIFNEAPYKVQEFIKEKVGVIRQKYQKYERLDRARLNNGPALIGKYLPVSDIEFTPFVEGGDEGMLVFTVKDIEHPRKDPFEIMLNAKLAPRELSFRPRMTRYPKIGVVLNTALHNFEGRKFIIEPNCYGIDGIATADYLAVAEPFKDNDIAKFHEVAHLAGIDLIPYIKGGEKALNAYIVREGKEYRQLPQMRQHYAIRLFQRQEWGDDDKALTELIRKINKEAEVLPVKPVKAPVVSPVEQVRKEPQEMSVDEKAAPVPPRPIAPLAEQERKESQEMPADLPETRDSTDLIGKARELFELYWQALKQTNRRIALNGIPEAIQFKNLIEQFPQPYKNAWLRSKFYWAQDKRYIEIANEELAILREGRFTGAIIEESESANRINYILKWFEKARSGWIKQEYGRIKAEYKTILSEYMIKREEEKKLSQEAHVKWRTWLVRARQAMEDGNFENARELLGKALASAVGKEGRKAAKKAQELFFEINKREMAAKQNSGLRTAKPGETPKKGPLDPGNQRRYLKQPPAAGDAAAQTDIEFINPIEKSPDVVIWDWDRTLFDTELGLGDESPAIGILAELLRDMHGGNKEDYMKKAGEYFRKTQGLTNSQRFKLIVEEAGMTDKINPQSYADKSSAITGKTVKSKLEEWKKNKDKVFIPGALEICRDLHARGVTQYIVTGNTWLDKEFLRAMGMDYFEAVYSEASWNEQGKYTKDGAFDVIAKNSPNSNIMVVSDGAVDIETGNKLKMRHKEGSVYTTALSYPKSTSRSVSSIEELRAANPDAIILGGKFPAPAEFIKAFKFSAKQSAAGDAAFKLAQKEADRMREENLEREYMPVIPEKTILCHIITNTILPPKQRPMLKHLQDEMAGSNYSEKVVQLKMDDNSSDFMNKLEELISEKRKEYEGYEVQFGVACPDRKLVELILKSRLGVKALAFKPCKDIKVDMAQGGGITVELTQVQGIILALRALNSDIKAGKIQYLREAFKSLAGKDIDPEELAKIKTIDDFMKGITFDLPVNKVDYDDIERLNRLIMDNIKSAA